MGSCERLSSMLPFVRAPLMLLSPSSMLGLRYSLLIINGEKMNEKEWKRKEKRRKNDERWASVRKKEMNNNIKYYNKLIVDYYWLLLLKVDEERTEQGSSEYGTGEDTVETALHIACYLKDRNKALEMTKILLEYGANVNKVRKFLENERIPPSFFILFILFTFFLFFLLLILFIFVSFVFSSSLLFYFHSVFYSLLFDNKKDWITHHHT